MAKYEPGQEIRKTDGRTYRQTDGWTDKSKSKSLPPSQSGRHYKSNKETTTETSK